MSWIIPGERVNKEVKKMSRIKYGQAEIIKELKTGITLVKFNKRYYTCYGRMFAVAKNRIETPYNEVCKMVHYSFCDWNTHQNLFREEQ
jgi:hypothetical protein